MAAIYLEELGFVGAILLLLLFGGAPVADHGRRLAVEGPVRDDVRVPGSRR